MHTINGMHFIIVPRPRLELGTNSLKGYCSTIELPGHNHTLLLQNVEFSISNSKF